MKTTAFWALYVGITILIGSVCHHHTAVEGRPGKSPGGKAVGKSFHCEWCANIDKYKHKTLLCLMFAIVLVI